MGSPRYIQAARRAFMPPQNWTVDEWADNRRWLSGKSAKESGWWRTSKTPYLREIMRELSPRSRAREVVFIAASQVGKTESANNFLGFIIDQAPGPVMFVLPTTDLAKRHSKQRIAPLIEESPCLRGLVKPSRSRDSGNTTLVKEFPGGILVLAGANSASGLKSTPIKYLITDEEDSYPLNVDEEGSPVKLAQARQTTFEGAVGVKHLRTSTPTIKGLSSIEEAYEASDQRQYWVPCPHCQEMQVLQFERLEWPAGKPGEAKYRCQHCDELIEERHKTWFLENGEWRRSNIDSEVPGFHLSGLYSPYGWLSWSKIATEYELAKRNPNLMRTFQNTRLGQSYQDSGEAPEWQLLYARREQYPLGTAPMGVLFLTAGIDVQRDRLEIQVVGWGSDKQSWLVDYSVLDGDTSRQDVWKNLAAYVARSWPHASGIALPLTRYAIDSGYATQDVYAWARTQFPAQCLVVKGFDSGAVPIGQPSAVEVTVNGRKYKRGVKMWPVATGILKAELYRWLKLDKPTQAEEPFLPGYCHFPEVGDEFFKQLTAEQLVVKPTKQGFKKLEWQKVRDRNEALDTRVYARAAAAQFGIDRFDERRWKQLHDAISVAVEAQEEERIEIVSQSPTKPPASVFRPKPITVDDPYS